MVKFIVDRYCKDAMPVLFSVCNELAPNATENAGIVAAYEIGRKMLRRSEAFAKRDYTSEASGDSRHWCMGVAAQKTCKWNAFIAKTAVVRVRGSHTGQRK